jgi:hypothetical protein
MTAAALTGQRPLYARILRLKHISPSGMTCFVLFEAMIALGVLLALTELVTWWAVPVLPAAVAIMVKINDVVAGTTARSQAPTRPAVTARPAVRRPVGGVYRARSADDPASESTVDLGGEPTIEAAELTTADLNAARAATTELRHVRPRYRSGP